MKRLTALIVLLLLVLGLGAVTVTIGDNSEIVDYLPIEAGNIYNYTQQIYSNYQIGHIGEISKIRFYHHHSSGGLANSNWWTIYMGLTSRHVFTSLSDWEPYSNLTPVFHGNVSSCFPRLKTGWRSPCRHLFTMTA